MNYLWRKDSGIIKDKQTALNVQNRCAVNN